MYVNKLQTGYIYYNFNSVLSIWSPSTVVGDAVK